MQSNEIALHKVLVESALNLYYIEIDKDYKLSVIGETSKQMLKHNLAKQWDKITINLTFTATGTNFNLPGHLLADHMITVI